MPFTATTFNSGGAPGIDSGVLNTMQTQYSEAVNSFEQDFLTAYVLSGFTAAKDGTTATQLDVAAGIAFVTQTDGTERRRNAGALTYSTVGNPSTTMYLDLNPDGSWSWGTSHSAVANHLTICSVTTDASANIATVTDARTTSTTLFAGMVGTLTLPTILGFNRTLSAGNQLMDWQQSYSLWSDNVGSALGAGWTMGTTRLWFNAPDQSEVHFGPRGSTPIISGFRIRSLNVMLDATNGNSETPGVFSVKGGMTTSLDAGNITTDGSGNVTLASPAMLTGRIHGDGHLIVPRTTTSAAGPYVDFDVDTTNHRIIMYPQNNGTDTNAYGFDFRYRAVSGGSTTSALYINPTGGLGLDNGTITTDGAGTIKLNSKWINWQGTLAGAAKQMFGFTPTDVGTKSWAMFYNTDYSLSWYNATDNKTALKLLASGGITTDSGNIATDGSGNATAVTLTAKPSSAGDGLLLYNVGATKWNSIGTNSGGDLFAYDHTNNAYIWNGITASTPIQTNRNGTATAAAIFTGTTSPVNPPTGAVWIKA